MNINYKLWVVFFYKLRCILCFVIIITLFLETYLYNERYSLLWVNDMKKRNSVVIVFNCDDGKFYNEAGKPIFEGGI